MYAAAMECVILGAGGRLFTCDARKGIAAAIQEAEIHPPGPGLARLGGEVPEPEADRRRVDPVPERRHRLRGLSGAPHGTSGTFT